MNGCCVPAGVWHPTLEAEESVSVSGRFELTIFLVRNAEELKGPSCCLRFDCA
jgi:hypothetical protein